MDLAKNPISISDMLLEGFNDSYYDAGPRWSPRKYIYVEMKTEQKAEEHCFPGASDKKTQ